MISPDRVQALLDIAANYLETLPGTPADDHTLVVAQVNAEALDVPAGTSIRSGTCHVEGEGAIEPTTAERLLCTARVQGALVGRGGTVMALGRSHRLATRAQRRALTVRDSGICQFPGCQQVRHLDAPHIVPWSHGGATDLDNLLLLCGRHHTLVQEGGLRIGRAPEERQRSWDFQLPDGRRVDADGYQFWRHVDEIAAVLASTSPTEFDPSVVPSVFPAHGGAAFSLDECVRVLFGFAIGEELADAA